MNITFDPAVWGEVSAEERSRVIQELSKPLPPADPLPKAENGYKPPPGRSDDDLDFLLSAD